MIEGLLYDVLYKVGYPILRWWVTYGLQRPDLAEELYEDYEDAA